MNSDNSEEGNSLLNEDFVLEDSNVNNRVKNILGKIMEYTDTKKSAIK